MSQLRDPYSTGPEDPDVLLPRRLAVALLRLLEERVGTQHDETSMRVIEGLRAELRR